MTQTISLQQYMQMMATKVEDTLLQLLPTPETLPKSLHQAMRYSACGGGKRLRAILAIEASGLRGAPTERSLPLAASLEMIHAYSLIHDDLPCMDDDDYRRGKPTNHKVFGEAIAVLAGDALLTQAFILLSQLPEISDVPSEVAVRIISEVATAAGSMGLVGGQVVDLESEGMEPGQHTYELLRSIHTRKTGALFHCALRSGALLGGLTGTDLDAIDTYAENFGLAFQITDDILDVIGDSTTLGKPTGSDTRHDKLTYPKIFGIERSRDMALEAVEAGKASLSSFGVQADRLIKLAQYVVERNH